MVQNPRRAFILLSAVFFYWGVLTAINSATIPFFRQVFSLSWRDSMLVNVAFYLAPFVICLPCSGWMARLGYRSALLLALILAASGSVVIAVSLWLASFAGCLVGIFIVAMGVAAMQVVANPYVNRLGEAQSAAGRLSLASSINSLGAALAPVVLAVVLAGAVISVPGMYLGLMLVGGILLVALYRFSIADFRDAHENIFSAIRALRRYAQFRTGVSGILVYVGVEVSMGTTALSYLHDPSLGGFSLAQGTSFIALYWGGALAGRFLYGLLAHCCRPQLLFCLCSSGAVLLTVAAIVFANRFGGYCLLATGLMNSVMYPIIFSRTLSGLDRYAASISACLIMAGIGGGVLPFIQGMVIDAIGLRLSFWVPVIGYLFLLLNGFKLYARTEVFCE